MRGAAMIPNNKKRTYAQVYAEVDESPNLAPMRDVCMPIYVADRAALHAATFLQHECRMPEGIECEYAGVEVANDEAHRYEYMREDDTLIFKWSLKLQSKLYTKMVGIPAKDVLACANDIIACANEMDDQDSVLNDVDRPGEYPDETYDETMEEWVPITPITETYDETIAKAKWVPFPPRWKKLVAEFHAPLDECVQMARKAAERAQRTAPRAPPAARSSLIPLCAQIRLDQGAG